MLESLSGLSKSERQSALSSVTLSLLPSPTIEPQHQIDEELRRHILADSREQLSLTLDDNTADTLSRMVNFLGDQISESILRGADFNRIKSRLGDKGSLLPSEYEIKINPDFQKVMEQFRLDETEVIETISDPDNIQHFFRSKPQDLDGGCSLCVRSFGSSQDRYALIVGLDRVGYTLFPVFAWRVFFSEVDIQSAHSPLEVVKAFANRYGFRYQIANLPITKFYENESLAPKPGNSFGAASSAGDIVSMARIAEYAKSWILCGIVRRTSLGVIILSFSFALDLDRYGPDLAKHGIEILSNTEMEAKTHFSRLQIGKLQS